MLLLRSDPVDFLPEPDSGPSFFYFDLITDLYHALTMVKQVLPEIDLVILLPVGGEGPQRFLTSFSILLVGGYHRTASAGLNGITIDIMNGKMFQFIFFKRISAGKNNIGTEAIHWKPFRQA